MIKNTYITKSKEALINRRKELAVKKTENQLFIADSGITKNARNKTNLGFADPEKLKEVRKRISENIVYDKEIVKIKLELSEIYKLENTERNMALINLFKEIFEPDQLAELYSECDRRIKGETPFKISFVWKEFNEHKSNAAKYKKMVLENIDNMQAFRLRLTNLIDEGCNKFGKAEFLKFISPLNRLILPVGELEKMKRKIIG
jgi:hypothetical protein